MKLRHLAIYLVLAVAVAGLYFLDANRHEQAEKKEASQKILFHVDADRIDRITLQRGGQTIDMAKESCPQAGWCWRILEPIQTQADSAVVGELAGLLAGMRASNSFNAEGESSGAFGLDTPSLSVAFESSGGASGAVFFGSRSPVDEGVYARRAGSRGEILVVPQEDFKALERNLFELRDKRLFSLNPREVTEAEIITPDASWHFLRDGGVWRLDGEPDLRLDSGRVDTIVGRFVWAEAASFEEDGNGNLAGMGLAPPLYRIRLAGAGKEETLLIGRSAGHKGERFFGCMAGRSEVFTVKGWLVSDIPRTEAAFVKNKAERRNGADEKGRGQ